MGNEEGGGRERDGSRSLTVAVVPMVAMPDGSFAKGWCVV